jgi:hypothetical protein
MRKSTPKLDPNFNLLFFIYCHDEPLSCCFVESWQKNGLLSKSEIQSLIEGQCVKLHILCHDSYCNAESLHNQCKACKDSNAAIL